MEQMRQNEAGALTAQAIPQKDVEQACFHALGLIGRNCEYLDQHLAHVGADQQTRQAVNDISAASARLDRTVNEVMSLLDFLRTEEDPRLYPLDLCQLLQQVAAQADMVQAQLGVELTLDYGGWTACRVMADRNDAELLCLHLLSNALRACSAGGKVRLMLRRSESFWQLTVMDNGCGLPEAGEDAWLENRRWLSGRRKAGPAALPRVLPPYGLGPAGGARTGKGHTGSGDHSAVHRPHNGADGRAAYGRRYGTGTAASVPAAQYAGAGAAYHAGARRPGRAVMHAA